MLLSSLLFFAGLLLLYFGAEYLVSGSSRLALSYGWRPLVVGMTIVAFATSMPELMVSLTAALKGSGGLAAGNIIGSNIANIGLILGCAALLHPLRVVTSTLTREIPFMLAASLLMYLLVLDGHLGFVNGLALFLLLLVFLAYCLRTARSAEAKLAERSEGAEPEESVPRGKCLALILLGIIGLGLGAELMVRSAVSIARELGVSEAVIGLSVVALGTSLPELAASLMSAWKGEMEISIGNVIGSNIFNLAFVLGLCPMLQPIQVDAGLVALELPLMLGFSLALWGLLWHRRGLSRGKGAGLLLAYFGFVLLVFR